MESVLFRILRIPLQRSASKKNAENLESTSITSYCFSLFVSFKIVGIIGTGVSAKALFGNDKYIKARSNLRLFGVNSYLFKEKTSAIDFELLERTKINTIVEFQYDLFSMFMIESGTRFSSASAVNETINGFSGIALRDIQIRRKIFLQSNARYTNLCSANFLISLLLIIVGFTTKNLINCIESEQFEIKQEFIDYPLFSKCVKDEIWLGVSMKNQRPIMKWISNAAGIPISLLAINSRNMVPAYMRMPI